MKKYGVKAVVPMLVVALVLGLAVSGFSQGKWVFGVKGNITWVQPLKAGGDFAQDYNDLVDEWNIILEDWKEWLLLEDPENEITIDLAEKITRAYSIHAYAERRIGQRWALRATGEYLWSNQSTSSYNAYYFDRWWLNDHWWEDWWTDTYDDTMRASAWKLAIAPRFIIPVGRMVLNVGGGPFYFSTRTSYTEHAKVVGDWFGELLSSTSDLTLTGSGWGYYLDFELKFKLSDRMAMNVEVGYESTPKITTSGVETITGEDKLGPIDEEYDWEGASDWTGFYVAVSLEFDI